MVKETQRKEKIICNFCGEPVRYYKLKYVAKLFNVEQNPVVLYFCSKECKFDWIYQTQKKIKTKTEMSKKVIFGTWNNICLTKLKERGRLTQQQWGEEMGYENSFNMHKIIKNNIDKLKITKSPTTNLKFYEIKEGVKIKND